MYEGYNQEMSKAQKQRNDEVAAMIGLNTEVTQLNLTLASMN